jgi:hypothetical protein
VKYSGHETFPFRYAWLPKAYQAIALEGPKALSTDEHAMVRLGVGKNMVNAIRFWMVATGIVKPLMEGGYQHTAFGRLLLDPERGTDPYLEDLRTLWLLHWRLCSNSGDDALFAWDFMLNRWHQPEINRTEVLPILRQEAERERQDNGGRPLSDVTLEQHFDVFLHTYVPTRSRKGEILEDNLDSPLVELDLITAVGERRVDATGRRETVYAFRRERKPEITPALFAYCLDEFWRIRHENEQTLSFRQLSSGNGSPGQVFKLPEDDLRERMSALMHDTGGCFLFRESSALPHIVRAHSPTDSDHLLGAVYHGALSSAVTHV